MDDIVVRSMAKWPDVADVYGWLSLDRRGNWLIRNERIGNRALREFIARNYQPDARGCWYFQNGPQRVFVALAYAPLVVHFQGDALVDQCERPFRPDGAFLDEEGSVLFAGPPGAALLDDRDLERFSERAEGLARILRGEASRRFGYVPEPSENSPALVK